MAGCGYCQPSITVIIWIVCIAHRINQWKEITAHWRDELARDSLHFGLRPHISSNPMVPRHDSPLTYLNSGRIQFGTTNQVWNLLCCPDSICFCGGHPRSQCWQTCSVLPICNSFDSRSFTRTRCWLAFGHQGRWWTIGKLNALGDDVCQATWCLAGRRSRFGKMVVPQIIQNHHFEYWNPWWSEGSPVLRTIHILIKYPVAYPMTNHYWSLLTILNQKPSININTMNHY